MENFGKKGRDKVTGFEGIITSKICYMYGCAQYGLTPKIDNEGKRRDTEYFDEGRIEILEQVINPDDVKVAENGCDTREYPTRQ
jgi:hypothetical protein